MTSKCVNCERLNEEKKPKKKVRDDQSIGEYRDDFEEILCGVCYFDACEERDSMEKRLDRRTGKIADG